MGLSGDQGMVKLGWGPSYIYLGFPQISQLASVHAIWQRPCEVMAKRHTYSIWKPIYGCKTPPWIRVMLVPWLWEQLWAYQVIEDASVSCKEGVNA